MNQPITQQHKDFAEMLLDHWFAGVTYAMAFRAFGHTAKHTVALMLITGMVGFNIFGTPSLTNAYYHDTEASTGNFFVAAELDFELDGSAWTPPEDALDLDPGDVVTRDVSITDSNSIDFKYIVTGEQTAGDAAFCDALEVEVFLEGSSVYTGALFDFVSATSTFGVAADDWSFDISLEGGTSFSDGETCEFDFVYHGWQERFDGKFDGYHDEERTSNTLVAHSNQCIVLDFETDAFGAPIEPGQVIDTEYSPWGITISASNDSADGEPDTALAFDSASPSGGDYDLGTPHTDFGGFGVGTGGQTGAVGENNTALQNILIIAEDIVDGNGDDLIDDPDDELYGGTLWFSFDAPTYVSDLTFIDIESTESSGVRMYDDGGLISTSFASGYGNNSVEHITTDTDGVTSAQVFLQNSGAIDNFCITPIIEDPSQFVRLNEVLADPDVNAEAPINQEFIEIYNTGLYPVDIAGYRISELSGGDEAFYPIVATGATSTEMQVYSGTTVLPSKGSLVLHFGSVGSKLNNGGDTVRLYNADGDLLDEYTYTTSVDGKSDARIPDGFGDWVDPEPTPEAPNIATEEELKTAGFDEQKIAEVLGIEEEEMIKDDTNPPVITILGNNPARVTVGSNYSDIGARVTDDVNWNIGLEVYDEDVDTNTLGTYEVMYVAFDQSGNMGSAVRIVEVVPVEESPTEIPTEEPADSSEETAKSEEEGKAEDGDEVVDESDTEEDQKDDTETETLEEKEEPEVIVPSGGSSANIQEQEQTEEEESEQPVAIEDEGVYQEATEESQPEETTESSEEETTEEDASEEDEAVTDEEETQEEITEAGDNEPVEEEPAEENAEPEETEEVAENNIEPLEEAERGDEPADSNAETNEVETSSEEEAKQEETETPESEDPPAVEEVVSEEADNAPEQEVGVDEGENEEHNEQQS